MSELETSEVVDNLDAELGMDDMLDADDGTHESTEEQVNEDSSQEATDIAELDKDTLAQMLLKEREAKGKLDKSRRELQSMHDRQYSEQSKQIAKLEGMVQAMAAARQSEPVKADPSIAAKENNALVQKWKEEIEEDPKRAVDLIVDAMSNMDRLVEERVNNVLNTMESKVSDLDPSYRENKELVDMLVQETGIDRKKALATVNVLTANKSIVRQPARVPAPGIVGAPTRRTAQIQKPPQLIELDDHFRSMVQLAGLSEEAVKRLRTVDA